MENNIQNELQDEAIQDNEQYENEVDPLAGERQQTEALQDDETDEDELDLGDADGSGGELEDEVDDFDD